MRTFGLVTETQSTFNNQLIQCKQCKIRVSNHPCCWNNYTNTAYSCHIRKYTCNTKLFT